MMTSWLMKSRPFEIEISWIIKVINSLEKSLKSTGFQDYHGVNEANPILELNIAHHISLETLNQMNFPGFFLHLKRNFLMLEPNSKLIFFNKWWTWEIWLNNSELHISTIIKMFLKIMIKSKSRVHPNSSFKNWPIKIGLLGPIMSHT